MENQQPPPIAWFWQDYVSTYRFWGLVLASFLMTCSSAASMTFLPMFLRDIGVDIAEIGTLYSIGVFGTFIGALLVLYFLRQRLKSALIIFVLISVIASTLVFSGKVTALPGLIILSGLMRLSETGFTITVIAVIVSGRPEVKSFLIPYFIIMFWNLIARVLASVVMALALQTGYGWLAAAPALFAVLALALMSGTMFSVAPEARLEAKAGPQRNPFVVFLLSTFIPFYYLVWIFKRPAEMKALAPNLKQPSRGGALMTALFAPYVLPIWFHNVREGLQDKLPNRSAPFMGVITFFLPTVAAAMAQSDNNAISLSDE